MSIEQSIVRETKSAEDLRKIRNFWVAAGAGVITIGTTVEIFTGLPTGAVVSCTLAAELLPLTAAMDAQDGLSSAKSQLRSLRSLQHTNEA